MKWDFSKCQKCGQIISQDSIPPHQCPPENVVFVEVPVNYMPWRLQLAGAVASGMCAFGSPKAHYNDQRIPGLALEMADALIAKHYETLSKGD